ncbi:MAG: alpha/beta hydrolase [Desulfopila sp.]|jgi:hypothetical protein|nr:alpha/beta hydrolase [Desulfopila sp.]
MKSTSSKILQFPPEHPDTSEQYLFYLHGLIVEISGIRPKSEEHGYYEYELILERLAEKGLTVISEAREKDTQIQSYAEKISTQAAALMKKGVRAKDITIVGASKGGAIAAYVSNSLRNEQLNFVFLAGLFEKYLVDENLKLYGNVLSIHDSSDKLGITPQKYFQRSEGLGTFQEIILELGKGHGLIYQPYREWLDPMMEWLQR